MENSKILNDEQASKISTFCSNLMDEENVCNMKNNISYIEKWLSDKSNTTQDEEVILQYQQSLESYKKIVASTDLNQENCKENINFIIKTLLNHAEDIM